MTARLPRTALPFLLDLPQTPQDRGRGSNSTERVKGQVQGEKGFLRATQQASLAPRGGVVSKLSAPTTVAI